jgi:hypothetical protein
MERNFTKFAFNQVCNDARCARKGAAVAKPLASGEALDNAGRVVEAAVGASPLWKVCRLVFICIILVFRE